ncbi:MAG: ECF transporter S component [Clostridia bacterium]|nr:ECF transporter S component [Clostridia bacterium]
MKKKKIEFFSARNISILAVLVALVVVLQLWGSVIPIGVAGLNLSFVLVPITLGAILLGPVAGVILGFVFGFVVLMTGVAGTNFFTAYVLNDSPFFTVITVLLKGMAAGFVAGMLYKAISKKNKYVAVFVAAAAVPLLNTGIFILGALCMSGSLQAFVSAYMPEFDGRNIMYIIVVGLVTVNFFIEFAINLICAPALYTVETVVEKQILKKKNSCVSGTVASNGGEPDNKEV